MSATCASPEPEPTLAQGAGPRVLPPTTRAGLLVAVVSGGRPQLSERPVRRLLAQLRAYGVADIIWSVSSRHVADYEDDGNEISVYSDDWAYSYAERHWMQPTKPEPGGFFGAFPGREHACLEAERRGCWGVLQLDDNIDRVAIGRHTSASIQVSRANGGLALFADILGAVLLSTNGRMVGANMAGVNPSGSRSEFKVARAGFPYSCFIEQVGPGREHWHGPFEDDITQALQYSGRADGATSVVVPTLRYHKETTAKTGMRAAYNHERSVQLQRLFPQSAGLTVVRTRSNGRGDARVFHKMTAASIKNQLRVTDRDLFLAAKTELERVTREWTDAQYASNVVKVHKRTRAVHGE